MEDAALFFAGRIQTRYEVKPPLRRSQLLTICNEEGIELEWVEGFEDIGQYVAPPARCIVLDLVAPAWIIAHELMHDLLLMASAEEMEHLRQEPEERVCDRFATELCGPMPLVVLRARRLMPFYEPADDDLPPPPLTEDDATPAQPPPRPHVRQDPPPPSPGGVSPDLLRIVEILAAEADYERRRTFDPRRDLDPPER